MSVLVPQDPLFKGQRCVILADGFYEWRKQQKDKQPFFIYFPQSHAVRQDGEEDKVKTEEQYEGEARVRKLEFEALRMSMWLRFAADVVISAEVPSVMV